MKSVLISINPTWCEKIVGGEKTIEVRKTRPKMTTPFKCYIYCTKGQERLVAILKDGDENYGEIYHGKPVFIKTSVPAVCDMYGKRKMVIGEFICNKIDNIKPANEPYGTYDIDDDYVARTCLLYGDMWNYGKGKPLFGWNISDFQLYDRPLELGEFTGFRKTKFGMEPVTITRPPQSWCYVEEREWND